MVDLTCSIEIALILGMLAAAYAVHVLRSGAASFDRVKRDKGSALFGAGAMQMGYWGLGPIGRVLAGIGVSANAISTTSLVFGVGAGVALAFGHFGVGALLAAVSTVCDALDGMVARHSGTASDSGEVLDAAVDRYVEFAFLGGLVIYDRDDPLAMGFALAAILGSFMVSYSTAKAEAMGVPAPRGAMRRPERALYLTLGAAFCPFAALWVSRGGPAWAFEAPILAATALVAIVGNVSAVRRLANVAAALRTRADPAARAAEGPLHVDPALVSSLAAESLHADPTLVPSRVAGREAVASEGSSRGAGRGEVKAGSKTGLLATFGRHQFGSVMATLIDFTVMSVLFRALGVPAAIATAIGAAVGGGTNFTLGRVWIFQANDAPAKTQAWRYAFVSLVSLSLNAGGEYVLHDRLGVQYLFARALVAIAVSVCWNFPLQKNFVYRQGPAAAGPHTLSLRATPDPR